MTVPGPMTLFCWVKPTSQVGGQLLLGMWRETTSDWTTSYITPNSTNTHNAGSSSTAADSNQPTDGVWSSIVGTIDIAAPAHQHWTNGQTNGAQTDTKTTFNNPTTRIAVGTAGDQTPGLGPDAAIAYPCLWDVVLNAGERLLLQLGVHPKLIRTASIQAFWGPMDNTAGETDRVNSHDLTESGTVAAAANPSIHAMLPMTA